MDYNSVSLAIESHLRKIDSREFTRVESVIGDVEIDTVREGKYSIVVFVKTKRQKVKKV